MVAPTTDDIETTLQLFQDLDFEPELPCEANYTVRGITRPCDSGLPVTHVLRHHHCQGLTLVICTECVGRPFWVCRMCDAPLERDEYTITPLKAS